MVKVSTAVPATPMKASGARGDSSSSLSDSLHMTATAERSISFEDDSADDHGINEDDEDVDDYDDLEEKTSMLEIAAPGTLKDARVTMTYSVGTKALLCNLVDELDVVARPEPATPHDDDDDDDDDDEAGYTYREQGSRTVYGDDDDGLCVDSDARTGVGSPITLGGHKQRTGLASERNE
ncbi:hypothetical protein PInf_025027 [Phytophthora infestans]|nr:hypothetical protein PInf_025027 [Phytophthora infestans]